MPRTRRLNRPLARPLDRCLNRRLAGRPRRPPNGLAEACRLLGEYLRLRRKTARAAPHLFGRHAGEYYRDTLRLEAQGNEVAAALDKVYGPAPPGSPPPSSVWVERYAVPPEQQPCHRKWFRKNYGN